MLVVHTSPATVLTMGHKSLDKLHLEKVSLRKSSLTGPSCNIHPTKISMHIYSIGTQKESTQQQGISSPIQGHAGSCSSSACVISGSNVVGSGSIWLMGNGDLGTNAPQIA